MTIYAQVKLFNFQTQFLIHGVVQIFLAQPSFAKGIDNDIHFSHVIAHL